MISGGFSRCNRKPLGTFKRRRKNGFFHDLKRLLGLQCGEQIAG